MAEKLSDLSRRKACDLCHRKKVRCDAGRPRCSNCVLYNSDCVFTPLQLQTERSTSQKQGQSKDRLARIEAWMQEMDSKVRALQESQDRNENGHAAGNSLPTLPRDGPEEIIRPHQTTSHLPLDEALSLINEFFQGYNAFFPLVQESSFIQLVELTYTARPSQRDPVSQAALDTVLALAHRLRAMRLAALPGTENSQIEEQNRLASEHLNASQAALSELTLRETDITCVQVLLGMIIVFQGTSTSRPATVLIPTAIRLAHRIRLHAADQFDAQGIPLDPALIEQRKRVFWIAFILDKDISLRTQQPPVQDDLDINLDLPNDNPVDGAGILYNADGSQKINFFRLRAHLAIIQGRIYQKVQSVGAAKQTREFRLQAVRDIEKELEDWSDQLPSDFQLERVAEVCNFNGPSLIHISILHATYFHALTMLNCICPLDKLWIGKVSKFIKDSPEAGQQERDVFSAELPSSWTKCIKISRLTLRVLSRIPQGDFAITWLTICAHGSALIVLLTNIFDRPGQPTAPYDIKLAEASLGLLEKLTGVAKLDVLNRICLLCQELRQKARMRMEQAKYFEDSGAVVEHRSKRRRLQQPGGEIQSMAPPLLLEDNIIVEPALSFVPAQTMAAELTWDDFSAGTELLIRQTPGLPEFFMVDPHKNDLGPYISPFGEVDEYWSQQIPP